MNDRKQLEEWGFKPREVMDIAIQGRNGLLSFLFAREPMRLSKTDFCSSSGKRHDVFLGLCKLPVVSMKRIPVLIIVFL